MNEDSNTGSLDTNVRLLAQRISTAETHLNRLGDTVRVHGHEISKVEAQRSRSDELIDYRLAQMEGNQKETSNRYWGIVAGLVLTMLITIIEIIVNRR